MAELEGVIGIVELELFFTSLKKGLIQKEAYKSQTKPLN